MLSQRKKKKTRNFRCETGYGRWGRVFLFSKSTPSYDTDTTQNCSPFRYRSIATKSEVNRFLAVPLDVSVVFNDFVILQDSYMEPTRVGPDTGLGTW